MVVRQFVDPLLLGAAGHVLGKIVCVLYTHLCCSLAVAIQPILQWLLLEPSAHDCAAVMPGKNL